MPSADDNTAQQLDLGGPATDVCVRREETQRLEAVAAVAEAEAEGGEDAEELVETLIDVYNSRLDSPNSRGQMMGPLSNATRHSLLRPFPTLSIAPHPCACRRGRGSVPRRPVLIAMRLTC